LRKAIKEKHQSDFKKWAKDLHRHLTFFGIFFDTQMERKPIKPTKE
jgi:hypothetical protein